MTSYSTLKNKYQEDLPVIGANLIYTPCVVYSITICLEADGDAVVSFSDSQTYDSASRVLKLVTSAENKTIHVSFPEGKKFDTGLSAISNVSSVDVSITYQ